MSRNTSTPLSILVVVFVAALGILIGAALGGVIFAPEEPEAPPDPVWFSAESFAEDDRIVHTFTPDTDDLREYRVSYQIFEDGTTIETVDDRPEELSSTEPLVVEIVDRDFDAEYRLDIRIHDEFDRLVYDVSITVGPVAPPSDRISDRR